MNPTPPSDRDALLRSIDAALAAGDMRRAIALAAKALLEKIETPKVLNIAAYGQEIAGNYDTSLRLLQRAATLAPRDPSIWYALGACCNKMGKPAAALAAFKQSLELAPTYAPPFCGQGHAHVALGDNAAARADFERAASLAADFAEPLGALASMEFSEKRYDSAADYVRRALSIDANDALSLLTRASLAHRQGDQASAERDVRSALEQPTLPLLSQSAGLRLLGDLLHEQGRANEAMDAYEEANLAVRQVYDAQPANAESATQLCERLIRYFGRAEPEAWRARADEAASGPAAGHVFLVGFPRSGTTLLEQVLASHPQVEALEEQPTLGEPFQAYFSSDSGLRQLQTLSQDAVALERAAYWRRVRDFGVDPAGKIFVDKMPLNTVLLPLVAKLFPHAKIIFALRDPRDVVLSCFRRRFRPMASQADYTDLQQTAVYYDRVMRLATLYENLLGLETYRHTHERMVQDFDAEVQKLCAFLGIVWDERMRNFVETANRRTIRTPSAGQVREGLNTSGIDKWRDYAPRLTTIEPILKPWVEAYGYTP